MKVVVIQGPNINLLGVREPHIYGPMRMEDIHENMRAFASQNNIEVEFFQSNLEGEIVDRIQECIGNADAIVINPAAYTHTSIAIRDAILSVGIPTIETHISNPARREEFRHASMVAAACHGTIAGFGPFSYHLALIAAIQIANEVKAIQEASKAQNEPA
jgi:3-dehydroquinate dehydratase II